MPNPVVLNRVSVVVSTAVGVQIIDNDEYLPSGHDYVNFLGLYQNGVQVGTATGQGNMIDYNGHSRVLQLYNKSGYTFGIMLYSEGLPNGDYIALMSYDDGIRYRTYNVPLRIAVS